MTCDIESAQDVFISKVDVKERPVPSIKDKEEMNSG